MAAPKGRAPLLFSEILADATDQKDGESGLRPLLSGYASFSLRRAPAKVPLTEPTAATRPWLRNLVLMRRRGHVRAPGTASSGERNRDQVNTDRNFSLSLRSW